MKLRFWLKIMAVLALLGLAVILGCQHLVTQAAAGRLYSDPAKLPDERVALLPGCVKIMPDGRPNLFFIGRIEAAAQLYKAGKVKAILVSGDNHRDGYDEPTDMKEALIAAGVPEARITCDYAGLRTLDSVMRAKKVFGLERVLLVSQRFQNERALYLAQGCGLNAIAFDAHEVELGSSSWKTYVREVFARVKAVLDVHVLHTQPKFLGPPVKVEGA